MKINTHTMINLPGESGMITLMLHEDMTISLNISRTGSAYTTFYPVDHFKKILSGMTSFYELSEIRKEEDL